MKNLLLVIFCSATLHTFSQNFEGTITWSIKTEFIDPARKAEMAENMRTAQDQMTYAKLKAMAAQNDPQFKKMMEDPKMKAEFEKAMRMSNPGMDGPTTMTVKIKERNMLTKMGSEMSSRESLFTEDKNQTYSIDREKKTYSPIPPPPSSRNQNTKVNVTKTEESATLLGHPCTKYIVESSDNGTKITQHIWATTELKDIDMQAIANQNRGQQWFFDHIEGFPLKIETKTPEVLFTMEVISILRESLPDSDFVIPHDFKQVKFGQGY